MLPEAVISLSPMIFPSAEYIARPMTCPVSTGASRYSGSSYSVVILPSCPFFYNAYKLLCQRCNASAERAVYRYRIELRALAAATAPCSQIRYRAAS